MSALARHVPAIGWLRGYQFAWLRGDVVAGVTLCAYLMPAGIGDASLAGLPPEANRPGGGAPLKRLDPDRLAEQVLEACRRRTSELVVPRKAAWLAGLVEWFPDWGRRLLARFTPAPSKAP